MTSTQSQARMAGWLERAWLVRYLDRELSADEVTWFEAYLLDKPELVECVEADANLRDALAAGASAKEAQEMASATAVPAVSTAFAAPKPHAAGQRWHARQMALAASLLVALALGWFSSRLLDSSAMPSIVVNPARVVYDPTRGDGGTTSATSLDSASTWLLVEAAVPPDATGITVQVGDVRSGDLIPQRGLVSFLLRRDIASRHAHAELVFSQHGSVIKRQLDLKTGPH